MAAGRPLEMRKKAPAFLHVVVAALVPAMFATPGTLAR
jgi:hypothetical protein